VEVGDGERLGVVGHDKIVALLEEVGVAGGVGEVDLLLVVRKRALVTLEGVVHGLGDREERRVAGYDLPVGSEAEIPQQGDLGPEDLRHGAAVGRGVQVKYARATQGLGQFP